MPDAKPLHSADAIIAALIEERIINLIDGQPIAVVMAALTNVLGRCIADMTDNASALPAMLDTLRDGVIARYLEARMQASDAV